MTKHAQDEDCNVGTDGCCTVCGVSHTAACTTCGGHGYRRPNCLEVASESLWATQGGGLVRQCGDRYVFVEKPECPGFDVGDFMPKEWGVVPANNAARQELEEIEFGGVV